MRKTLSLLLCAALCLCAAGALAEDDQILQVKTTLSFVGDVIYFGSNPEYFVVIPEDWFRENPTEEEAAQGLLLTCTDPEEILKVRILSFTDTEHSVDEIFADFAKNPSVANLTEMYIDNNYYIAYDVVDTHCYCATTTPGGGVYVTYMYSTPDGSSLDDALAELGTIPYEILGQFNRDDEE